MSVRTSKHYQFTADVSSPEDMKKIAILRKAVSNRNVIFEDQLRVVLRGRQPKEKYSIVNFWTGKRSVRSYDWAGNIVGGLKNATKFDVYIYERK